MDWWEFFPIIVCDIFYHHFSNLQISSIEKNEKGDARKSQLFIHPAYILSLILAHDFQVGKAGVCSRLGANRFKRMSASKAEFFHLAACRYFRDNKFD